MALKPIMGFALRVIGDGSDRTVTVTISTAPFGLVVPQQISGSVEVPPGFDLLSSVPTGIVNLASSQGHSISASAIALGAVTFTYAVDDMPANNEVDVIYGDFTFTG